MDTPEQKYTALLIEAIDSTIAGVSKMFLDFFRHVHSEASIYKSTGRLDYITAEMDRQISKNLGFKDFLTKELGEGVTIYTFIINSLS